MSIETKREIVAFDLVAFSIEMSFSLTITERQVQLLIKGEMYALIQDLVHGNTLLSIDVRTLDADELLQVQRINRKKNREDQTHRETEKNEETCGNAASSAAPAPAMDIEPEGGQAENNPNADAANPNIMPIGVGMRQRSYNRTPLHNDLQRVLELNDRNNVGMHASSEKRFTKSGRQNRHEMNYQDQIIQEEVDPVSFNSRHNLSQATGSSEGLQSPDG